MHNMVQKKSILKKTYGVLDRDVMEAVSLVTDCTSATESQKLCRGKKHNPRNRDHHNCMTYIFIFLCLDRFERFINPVFHIESIFGKRRYVLKSV